jgi:hypothetical protein
LEGFEVDNTMYFKLVADREKGKRGGKSWLF